MTKEIEEKVREQARQWFISSDMNVKDFALSVAKYVYEITTATPPADVQERAKEFKYADLRNAGNAYADEQWKDDKDFSRIEYAAKDFIEGGLWTRDYLAGASSLQAENERLREALEKIIQNLSGWEDTDTMMGIAINNARTALNKQ